MEVKCSMCVREGERGHFVRRDIAGRDCKSERLRRNTRVCSLVDYLCDSVSLSQNSRHIVILSCISVYGSKTIAKRSEIHRAKYMLVSVHASPIPSAKAS